MDDHFETTVSYDFTLHVVDTCPSNVIMTAKLEDMRVMLFEETFQEWTPFVDEFSTLFWKGVCGEITYDLVYNATSELVWSMAIDELNIWLKPKAYNQTGTYDVTLNATLVDYPQISANQTFEVIVDTPPQSDYFVNLAPQIVTPLETVNI